MFASTYSVAPHYSGAEFRPIFQAIERRRTRLHSTSLIRQDEPSSEGFTALLMAFRSSGGTARTDTLRQLIARPHGLINTELARLISTRLIFCFGWRGAVWVPMFQFEDVDLSIYPELRMVIEALAPLFNEWTMANWFARPNEHLSFKTPADIVGQDAPSVLTAAIAHRSLTAKLLTAGYCHPMHGHSAWANA